MKIKNISRKIYRNGNTDDIIMVVMMAYNIERDEQIRDIAIKLKGNDVYQTAQNIWEFLIKNIRYVPDVDSQKIKTPARLLHDGFGDCKSYSLFTAVVLRWLGIPHFFRFASYTPEKEATHVYVVAGGNIIIDAVSYPQHRTPFNTEIKYTWKADMTQGTKIYYVAGLKNSIQKIEAAAKNRIRKIGYVNDFSVWLGSEAQSQITPGKSWLYAQYDLISETAGITRQGSELNRLYTKLAIITACIHAYNLVNGNNAELKKIMLIIAGLVYDGKFSVQNSGNKNKWFGELLKTIELNYKNGIYPAKYSAYWFNLLAGNVISDNYLPDSINGTRSAKLDILAPTLKKAGIYFIYTFIPDADISVYDAAVARKRKTQLIFLNLIDKVDVFHKRETLIDFFRSGIIARTGMQPEAYIKHIKDKNIRIGDVLLTTSTILGIVIALVELIKAIWPQSEAAQYAPSSGVANLDKELYTPGKGTGKGTGAGTETGAGTVKAFMPWLLGGSLMFTMVMKKK